MSEHESRLEILHFGKMLHERGLIAATDGNISVRLTDGAILITPTCISKGMMSTEDLLVVDMHGRRLAGFRDVSSEIAMHLTIYRMRPTSTPSSTPIRPPPPALPPADSPSTRP